MHRDNRLKDKATWLQAFCQRYRAYARQGDPQRQSMPRHHNSYFDKGFKEDHYFETYSIPTVDINLAEEDLGKLYNDLAELDSENYHAYVRHRKALGEYFVLEYYEAKRKQQRECEIRKRNPGVQKAWETYQLVLKLAGG
jgi:hypothetical protein